MKPIVIKYGGSLLDEVEHRHGFLKDVAALSKTQSVVLVHGGGKEISRQMEKAGLAPRFVNGRRFTDEKTMDVVRKALAGLNQEIVQELNGLGVAAKGYSGQYDHVVEGKAIEELGRVGMPAAVNREVLNLLLKESALPVFYSVAEDAQHHPLNVNADDFALAIAIACGAARLVYLTDTGGVLDAEKKLIPRLTSKEVDALAQKGVINGGMLVKAQACLGALHQGVGSVDIVKGIAYLSGGEPAGTVFQTHGH